MQINTRSWPRLTTVGSTRRGWRTPPGGCSVARGRARGRAGAAIPVPADAPSAELRFDVDRVAASFATDAAADAWVVRGSGRFAVVRIDSVANIAVGGRRGVRSRRCSAASRTRPRRPPSLARPLAVVTEAGSTGARCRHAAGAGARGRQGHPPACVRRAAIDGLRAARRRSSSTWAGHPTTGPTPTSRRSALPAWSAARCLRYLPPKPDRFQSGRAGRPIGAARRNVRQ